MQGVHLLLIDLFPSSKRDPQGIHQAIWDQFVEEDLETHLIERRSSSMFHRFSRNWRDAPPELDDYSAGVSAGGRPAAALGLVRGICLNRDDSNVRIPSGVERT